MSPPKNLIGQRFGRLLVLERADNVKGRAYWLCQCDCGAKKAVMGKLLLNGSTQSCGCLMRERVAESAHNRAKHGDYKTRLYHIWKGMKDRCYLQTVSGYKNYGAKGIKVCDEWQQYIPFREWALSHGYTDKLTIDRINNDKDYCPENCRWATTKEQRHNSSQNHFLEYNNEKHTIDEWAEIINTNYHTLWNRIKCGWSVEDALTKPVQKQNKKFINEKE